MYLLLLLFIHLLCFIDDPEYGNLHPNHREFIQKKANFKQIVPITDEDILDCIHQNFRIQYFRVYKLFIYLIILLMCIGCYNSHCFR